MFFDPNDLPEDKLDELIDLTMDIFSESLSFISEIGDDIRLVRFIQQACSSYELSVMVDFPHPEWWPDHDMYADAEELDQAEDEAAVNAESEADEGETVEGAAGESDDNDDELEENQALENYVELSVVGTPTSNKKLEDDESEEPTQTVLASILLPISYLDKIGKVSNDQMLSAVELQWLPERNTFDD